MKYLIAFAVIIAGINALPQTQSDGPERIVTGAIIDAINDLSQSIKDLGLDPLNIKREEREYALPVPVIFNAAGFIEDLLSFGLSDIRVNRMDYSVLLFRLTYDVELPLIHLSVGDAYGEVTLFGETLQGEAAGSVEINSIRVNGQVNVSVGIISGISIRSLTVNFALNNINSNLKAVLGGYDLSEFVNTLLGETIPNTLVEYRTDINRLLEIIALEIANDILG